MNYIPSPNYFKIYYTYQKYPDIFKPTDRVPIRKIKIDKKRLDYSNDIYEETVNEIINNFHIEGWEPIFITPDFYLSDGHHRLKAAKKMGLKYIDVVIVEYEMLK